VGKIVSAALSAWARRALDFAHADRVEWRAFAHSTEGHGNVKIKRVEAIAVSFPMKKPVVMAGVEIRAADNVLIRIEADNGFIGWGEAASAPTMTGDTQGSLLAAVRHLGPLMIGEDAWPRTLPERSLH
jgi:hypothetical protein